MIWTVHSRWLPACDRPNSQDLLLLLTILCYCWRSSAIADDPLLLLTLFSFCWQFSAIADNLWILLTIFSYCWRSSAIADDPQLLLTIFRYCWRSSAIADDSRLFLTVLCFFLSILCYCWRSADVMLHLISSMYRNKWINPLPTFREERILFVFSFLLHVQYCKCIFFN